MEVNRGGHQRREGYYYPDEYYQHRESKYSRQDYYLESSGSRYRTESNSTLFDQVVHLGRRIDSFSDNLDDDRRETRKSLDSMKESFDSLSSRVFAVEKEQFGLEDRRRSSTRESFSEE
jgi:hypothetical protein